MTFISYAQNMEDVMLWRALKHIDQGFYIDVGANDPTQSSVTKAFYDNGWRGINLEPVSLWFEMLETERPRDINLQVAAGVHKGEVPFYEIPGTGLSTTDKTIAERHGVERGYNIVEYKVPVKPLSEICTDYHIMPIHFLKIDVEGSEKQVLEGIDFSNIRPWIIIIESTLPNTQIENYKDWESILLSADYTDVYFDGLNRYYLAQEHRELSSSFHTPVNVFDDFVFSEQTTFCSQTTYCSEIASQVKEARHNLNEAQASLSQQIDHSQWLESELGAVKIHREQVEAKAVQAEAKAVQAEAKTEAISRQLDSVYSSTSWRITIPLRKVVDWCKRLV